MFSPRRRLLFRLPKNTKPRGALNVNGLRVTATKPVLVMDRKAKHRLPRSERILAGKLDKMRLARKNSESKIARRREKNAMRKKWATTPVPKRTD